jgi:hypothetical protein
MVSLFLALKGAGSQLAEKLNVFEGDGLQAVRKSLKMHAASATEEICC